MNHWDRLEKSIILAFRSQGSRDICRKRCYLAKWLYLGNKKSFWYAVFTIGRPDKFSIFSANIILTYFEVLTSYFAVKVEIAIYGVKIWHISPIISEMTGNSGMVTNMFFIVFFLADSKIEVSSLTGHVVTWYNVSKIVKNRQKMGEISRFLNFLSISGLNF